mmetsp:Transcript_3896/g.14714  ORF Transcript_3896/g.14714 Transcript_3896/m.14714 type:complete len:368 (+) Transcript_3896:192-1295(+)
MSTVPKSTSNSSIPADSSVSDKYKKFVAEKKQRCAELASGYTAEKRMLEKIMISIFLVLFFFSLFQIFTVAWLSAGKDTVSHHQHNAALSVLVLFSGEAVSRPMVWSTILFGFILGMLSADFFSGCVHWFADTFCTKETAILGPLIRSFREHHVDQQAITRHDVIESNGDNCMFGNLLLIAGRVTCLSLWWKVPALPLAAAVLYSSHVTISLASLFLLTWATSFALMFALTNQIHKWSHQYSVPAWVKLLQDCRIILHRKDHMVHHTNPFDRYYCITTGWLNPVLNVTGFWRALEFIFESFSGGSMRPRADDMKWTSHMKILEDTPDIEDDSFFKSESAQKKIQQQKKGLTKRSSSRQSDMYITKHQ